MESSSKAGSVSWAPAGKHMPENKDTKAMDAILIELKTKPAMTMKEE